MLVIGTVVRRMEMALIGLLIFIYVAIIGVAIAQYVLTSLGLFKIAKGRQISYAWMAWVPVVSSFLIGRLTEDYDSKSGYQRPWKKVLLILNIASVAGMIVFYIMFFIAMGFFTYNISYSYRFPTGSIVLLVIAYIGIIISVVVAVGLSVFISICIYKIFEAIVPEKALKYTLLYAMVPLAGGICLFKCGKKVNGQPTQMGGTGFPGMSPMNMGYDQQGEYGQSAGYGQPTGYDQSGGYGQPTGFNQ